LDRGVIGDDDDDEDAEENGVNTETPNVGKLNQPPLTVYA
jgi:methionyl aminopeptidase